MPELRTKRCSPRFRRGGCFWNQVSDTCGQGGREMSGPWPYQTDPFLPLGSILEKYICRKVYQLFFHVVCTSVYIWQLRMCSVEKLKLRSRAIFKVILFCLRHTFIVCFEKKKGFKKREAPWKFCCEVAFVSDKKWTGSNVFTTFHNLLIFRMVGVFLSFFCIEQLWHGSTSAFHIVLDTLKFSPKMGHFSTLPYYCPYKITILALFKVLSFSQCYGCVFFSSRFFA